MRTIVIYASFLLLATTILGVSIWQQSQATVRAQSRLPDSEDQMEAAQPSATPDPMEYRLVYPGILPDHVLYPVKMARDRMRLWLTFNEEKATALKLLYADKRIGAAEVLMEGGELELAVKTAVKAEQYLFQASEGVRQLNDEAWWTGLYRSSVAHEEILQRLAERVSDPVRPTLMEQIEKVNNIQDEADERIPDMNGQPEKEPAGEHEQGYM